MSWKRKQLRHAVVSILKAAETAAGTRWYPNRFRPVWREDLPVGIVLVLDEQRVISTESPREYLVTLRLGIVGFVPATPVSSGTPARTIEADDLLDDLGQEVQDALNFDHSLGGLAADSRFGEWVVSELEPIDEVVMAAGRLVLEVDYLEAADEGGDPRLLADLRRVRAEHHLEGSPPGRVDALTDSTLPPSGG